MNEKAVERFYHYCEENGFEQDVKSVEMFKAQKNKRIRKFDNYDRYLSELRKCIKDENAIDYYIKKISNVVNLCGHLVVFEKPEIRTRFCFGYSDLGQGRSYEESQNMCRTFGESDFLRENLSWYDRQLDELKKGIDISLDHQYNKSINIYYVMADWMEGGIKCTPEMQKKYKEAVMAERAKFEKRLKSYLKRYGTSKIHTWTYWRDE